MAAVAEVAAILLPLVSQRAITRGRYTEHSGRTRGHGLIGRLLGNACHRSERESGSTRIRTAATAGHYTPIVDAGSVSAGGIGHGQRRRGYAAIMAVVGKIHTVGLPLVGQGAVPGGRDDK